MKILWICNIMLPAIAQTLGEEYSVKEGWLTGILNRLLAEEAKGGSKAEDTAGKIELGICFPAQGALSDLSRTLSLGESGAEVNCYGFAEDTAHPENYDSRMEVRFARIYEDFRPDMIHIFGTEYPHAYAAAKAWKHPEKTLVGIQGIISSCAEEYFAGLPEKVTAKRTFRDIVRKDSMRQQQQKFYLRGQREKELLKLAGHITGRTEFDRKVTQALNPSAVYHFMNETMRDSFYEGAWELDACRKHCLFLSQGDYPLKGFHHVLDAMGELRGEFPDLSLMVAGNSVLGTGGFKARLKIPAYGKYLNSLIRKNGLAGKVEVLGRLTETEMKKAYLACETFVCASSLENSPNSIGEAMLLGVPVAAAETGGIPSLLENGKQAILFEQGNAHSLTEAIRTLWNNPQLERAISGREAVRARRTHDADANYRRLLEIYKNITSLG